MNIDRNLVILVDDSIEDLETLCEILHEINPFLKCRTYADGELLLSDLSHMTELPAVIILDHNMPKMRGTECLKIIRNTEGISEIPVVICTTTITDRDHQYYDSQQAHFVKKQSNWESYRREISEALKATLSIKSSV